MRYPVGFRGTWREALDAAIESVRLTNGMRYHVYRTYHEMPDREVWHFDPVNRPPAHLHEAVRV